MIVQFHSLKWLQANAWEDDTDDYWPNEEAFTEWEATTMLATELDQWVAYDEIGKVLDLKSSQSGGNTKWAYTILTQEEYPEYYL